ncbi:MAG: tRNA (adenosine(37)-N6)-threonylcarbamoyltransferase complex ATPase subunit type 1 TsaE [Bacteroidales bacterium]|nr:tRNA (adenosine(37)-N6)-threonylcarbamoyltransferase complex ATPase subunit type 1 TsaE [Bacteroidales bacterium]
MLLKIENLDQIQAVAKEFISFIKEKKVFAFYGSMGAGKTTFIKALCEELGSPDIVTSPTFTLVNEYLTKSGNLVYHFDFYRIEKKEEAFDFGFEEYLYSGNLCFIEWPEKIESLLPDSTIKVRILVDNNNSRSIEADL